MKEVKINDEMLKAVPEFCYLGDMLSDGGGCELSVVIHCKCSWEGELCLLLLLPIHRDLQILTGGSMYSTCERRL